MAITNWGDHPMGIVVMGKSSPRGSDGVLCEPYLTQYLTCTQMTVQPRLSPLPIFEERANKTEGGAEYGVSHTITSRVYPFRSHWSLVFREGIK